MKKTISILLTAVLLLSCISFPGAIASEDDFIEIWTIEDLYNVRSAPDKNYILMTDIDFSKETDSGFLVNNKDWKTIDSFSGVFDGNHHRFIKLTTPFIRESTGTIKNLQIYDATFNTTIGYDSDISGYGFGAFTISNSGTLEYCEIRYSSIPAGKAFKSVFGGLVADNKGMIRYCANVKSDMSLAVDHSAVQYGYKNSYIGGLCGRNSGTIEFCYCNCDINISFPGYIGVAYWGGVCGVCGDNSGTIENCYYSGAFGAGRFTYTYTNGIAIWSEDGRIKKCYTTINKSLTGSYCYYQSNSGAANALSEVQMRQERYFVGFDFDNVWIIDPATEYKYPQLRDNRQDTDKLIDSIEFETAPTAVTFRTEDAMEASGRIRVHYIDGTHEDIDITLGMLSGYHMNTAGEQFVKVTYRGFTLTYKVTVTQRPEVIGVTLLSKPDKTEFVKDSRLDYTGGKARIFYRDGTTETVDFTPKNTSGVDITKTGTYAAKFTYHGFTVGFDVTIVPVMVTDITILSLPDKVTYIEGQSIDRTGLSVEGTYNNGERKLLTDYELTYQNTAGKQTVTVSYSGATATFGVTFNERVLDRIYVLAEPTKKIYYTDESFDPAGMVVYAFYNSELSEEIRDYTVSPIPDESGMQMLEISYGGKSTFITVTVKKRTLRSVEVTKDPNKTKYSSGEGFDPTGMTVTAFYDNGTQKAVDDYALSGILTDSDGSYVTVAYNGFSCRLAVHVHSYTAQTVAPTCTSDGYTTHICSDCGDYYHDDPTAASGHSYGKWEKLNEKEHRRICANDPSHVETSAHTWDKGSVTKTATCDTNGVKTYTCTVCKATKEEIVPATGHSFGAWKELNLKEHRRICASDPSHVETAAHNWDQGFVVAEPSPGKEGIKRFTCKDCGAVMIEPIESLPVVTETPSPTSPTTKPSATNAPTTEPSIAGPQYTDTPTTFPVTDPQTTAKPTSPLVTTENPDTGLTTTGIPTTGVPTNETTAAGQITEPTAAPTTAPVTTEPAKIELELVDEEIAKSNVDGKLIVITAYAYTLDALKSAIGNTADEYTITKPDGSEYSADEAVGTGAVITLKDRDRTGYTFILMGDADGNGSVNATDARSVLRAAAKLDTLDPYKAIASDVNGDNKIDAADARMVLRAAAKLQSMDAVPEIYAMLRR